MRAEAMPFDWISADWPAPANVRALCTTRSGGFSTAAWASMNLGEHCDDDPRTVQRNRAVLTAYLPRAPQWLNQVHGATVLDLDSAHAEAPEADAVTTSSGGKVCAVLTADCLPVLFCNRQGTRVAAAHAGWRGLANGVLEASVNEMDADPADVLAWLGPAIGPQAYEIGQEVIKAFPRQYSRCFEPRGGRWLMNLYELARMRLNSVGVMAVSGGKFCTFSDQERFYSYRRDGITGRQASMVWIT